MKTKVVLFISLAIMAAMIILVLVFPDTMSQMMNRPDLYRHVRFVHIISVTLFFSNAIVGMLWELRSLSSKSNAIVLHTYETVTWLDAHFSSPMIIISVTAGIMMSISMGGIWHTGWLALSFILFLFSGALWVITDIPTQYKIKALMSKVDPTEKTLPPKLMWLLKMRLWISLAGVIPLTLAFILMVYKPEIAFLAK